MGTPREQGRCARFFKYHSMRPSQKVTHVSLFQFRMHELRKKDCFSVPVIWEHLIRASRITIGPGLRHADRGLRRWRIKLYIANSKVGMNRGENLMQESLTNMVAQITRDYSTLKASFAELREKGHWRWL